jgi:bifunctional DNA-binding transcriptional regulator/antitoxin component of YhaV-PrlF toxin-antitoxin module
MTMLTVTAKGQITLRKDLLQHLGAEPGHKLMVVKLPDGSLAVRSEHRTGKISDLVGMFKRPGQPCLTIEEINEATAKGWAGER